MKSESQAHTELGHGDAGAPGDAELTVVAKSGGSWTRRELLKGGACCAELRWGRSGIVRRKLGDTQPVEEKGPKEAMLQAPFWQGELVIFS